VPPAPFALLGPRRVLFPAAPSSPPPTPPARKKPTPGCLTPPAELIAGAVEKLPTAVVTGKEAEELQAT
jgi:hypothetical protein